MAHEQWSLCTMAFLILRQKTHKEMKWNSVSLDIFSINCLQHELEISLFHPTWQALHLLSNPVSTTRTQIKTDLILSDYPFLQFFSEGFSSAMPDNRIYHRPTSAMIPFPYLSGHPNEALMGLITFSLRYFGCGTNEIWRVLDSYGFKHDVDFVSRYINRYNLVDHLYSQHGPKHDTVKLRARWK